MEHFTSLIRSVIIIVVLISTTFWLKRRNIVKAKDSAIFSKLVTEFTLPALIFVNLATQDFITNRLLAALIMLSSIVISMYIAFVIGNILKLENNKLGAFILVAGFGSSSTLGYPLIKHIFHDNPAAIANAMLIGELGVCLPFFIIGVMIVLYYGRQNQADHKFTSTVLVFFKSPIFIFMVLGIICSIVGLPKDNAIINVILEIFTIIGNSMIIFVAISIGLMLKPINIKQCIPLIIIIVVIKLIVEPLLSLLGANLLGINEIQKQVLLIEAAMPSGAVASVIADRYGCDGTFATVIVIITYIVSLVSLPLMFYLGVIW